MAADRSSRSRASSALVLIWLACAAALVAQQQTSIGPVPRVMWVSGVFQPVDRQPIAPTETVTLAVYSDQDGGNHGREKAGTFDQQRERQHAAGDGETRSKSGIGGHVGDITALLRLMAASGR